MITPIHVTAQEALGIKKPQKSKKLQWDSEIEAAVNGKKKLKWLNRKKNEI